MDDCVSAMPPTLKQRNVRNREQRAFAHAQHVDLMRAMLLMMVAMPVASGVSCCPYGSLDIDSLAGMSSMVFFGEPLHLVLYTEMCREEWLCST